MSSRKVRYKPGVYITPCPKCGNNTEFTVHSQQVMEDLCEIWAVCKCGFDPTENDSNSRVEDVWGGCDDNNCADAMRFTWNEVLRSKSKIND